MPKKFPLVTALVRIYCVKHLKVPAQLYSNF